MRTQKVLCSELAELETISQTAPFKEVTEFNPGHRSGAFAQI